MRTVHVDIICQVKLTFKPEDIEEFIIDELDVELTDTGNGGNIEDFHIDKKESNTDGNHTTIKVIVHAVLKLDDGVDPTHWLNDEMDYLFKSQDEPVTTTKIIDYDITDPNFS